MKLNPDKFKNMQGYQEGTPDAIDRVSLNKAADYKKDFLKKIISLNPEQIDSRMGDDHYYVTRKYDGEYAMIIYTDGEAVTINRSGRIRRGLPCLEEAEKLLSEAGLKEAILPAEIYVYDEKRKTRVNDLLSALADKKKIGTLRLAVFDILELNNDLLNPLDYGNTYKKLTRILSGGILCHPVDMEVANSKEDIKAIYQKWVEEEKSEGLVIRGDLPFTWKIKPRHSIDVVVIGFSEGTGDEKGQVRSLLTAFIPKDNTYQIVGRVASGLKEKLRKELYKKFSKQLIKSDFIETDANFVAFHMVRPDTVIQMSVNDFLYETVSGPKLNPLLILTDDAYHLTSHVNGVKFIAPVFERMRPDKKADSDDVRISQMENPLKREEKPIPDITKNFSQSELLSRRVFKKKQGDKVMIQKYMVWQTNKEETGEYPAYVLYYMNFSTDRQIHLQREVKISNNLKQIRQLEKEMMEANIKKGWEEVLLQVQE